MGMAPTLEPSTGDDPLQAAGKGDGLDHGAVPRVRQSPTVLRAREQHWGNARCSRGPVARFTHRFHIISLSPGL